MKMKMIGKGVLIVGIALVGTCVMTGCMTDETTGESVFVGSELLGKAATAITSIPDETKATALEGLAWLLGATGVGAAAVPLCKAGASYFRNKGKTADAVAAGDEGDNQEKDDTANA